MARQHATGPGPANTQPISQPLLAPEERRQSIDSSTIAPCSEHPSGLGAPDTPDIEYASSTHTISKKSEPSIPHIVLADTDSKRSTQLPTRRKGKRNVFMIWLGELLMILLAIGLLIAIIIILNRFHGEEQPRWAGFITLNALIAVLATIFRASLAYVAFEIIGQIKWDWVSRSPRSLWDIQLFDNASRGVPGSIRLLGLVGFRVPLVLVAILLAIVSLGIGSFTQQAIQTYSCLQPSGISEKANVTVASRIRNEYVLRKGYAASAKYNETWQLALEDAIVNPSNSSTAPADLLHCPTGNCTFTSYGSTTYGSITHASLGLCNRCADVHDLVEGPFKVQANASTMTIQLPVPPRFGENHTDSRLLLYDYTSSDYVTINSVKNLTWAGDHISLDMLNRERYAIQKFAILGLSQHNCHKLDNGTLDCPTNITAWGGPTDYVAATCIIYPCMQYYRGRVENNVLFEHPVSDTPLRPQKATRMQSAEDYYYEDWSGVQQPCRVNGTVYTSQNMSKANDLDAGSITTVMSVSEDFESENPNKTATYTNITAPVECVGALDGSLMDGFHLAPRNWFSSTCSVDSRGGPEFMTCDEWYNRNLLRNRTTTYDDLESSIKSVTRGLTYQMRRAAKGIYNDEPGSISLRPYKSEVCIKIAWKWITFPTALCAICVLLLAVVLMQTSVRKESPVWKNSSLPLLLKDHPGIGAMEISEIEKTAKGIIIKLHHEGDDQSMELLSKGNSNSIELTR